ncbi:inverted formin-2-like [Lingula anatina]|uniref:Inverted formin-2-like n=1 Tax=Lingula anatina TaxID=7574 RepID=A0A1S3H7Y3_LINAN|nr:inverted formin-2-like [Lingula anatina]|eukprot:XP_013382225.1 inverted formin-2-like [Lingula anatina]
MPGDKTIGTMQPVKQHEDGNIKPLSDARQTLDPAIEMYQNLRLKIEQSDPTWLQEFLELGGLDSLLEALQVLSCKDSPSLIDSVLELDCMCCVRELLNTQPGLQYISGREELVKKLSNSLGSSDILVRKQVFEILAVTCVHSQNGHRAVLAGLEYFKTMAHQADRLSIIMTELKLSETGPYRTAIVAFINCLLSCTNDLIERCRLRNEMAGLQLLDVLFFLKKEELDEDLCIQIDAFYRQKHKDELELQKTNHLCSNLGNVRHVFDCLANKVHGKQEGIHLLHVLQDLLFLSSQKSDSNAQLRWQTMAQTVHRLTFCNKNELHEAVDHISSKELSESHTALFINNNTPCTIKVVQNQEVEKENLLHSEGQGQIKGQGQSVNAIQTEENESPKKKLECMVPDEGTVKSGDFIRETPTVLMKTLNWVQVPEDNLYNNSVWTQTKPVCDSVPLADGAELEELFKDDAELQEVSLLSSPQSLRINLFLHALDMEPDCFVAQLAEGKSPGVKVDLLRFLYQALPEEEEVKTLQMYAGKLPSGKKLSKADQFVVHLATDIPDYRLLLHSLLFIAEYPSKFEKLKHVLVAMVTSCKTLMQGDGLRCILRRILDIGNFMNHGNALGQCKGFQVSSLSKLGTVRSSEPCYTLLHHVVKLTPEEELTKLLDRLPLLQAAASMPLAEVRTQFNSLNNELTSLLPQLSSSSPLLQQRFEPFLVSVRQQFGQLQRSVIELKILGSQLAEYLCENPSIFDLHVCFKHLQQFSGSVKRCMLDNEQNSGIKAMAEKRQAQLKEKTMTRRLAKTLGTKNDANSTVIDNGSGYGGVLDFLLLEIHQGNFHPKLRTLHCVLSPVASPIMADNTLMISEIAKTENESRRKRFEDLSVRGIDKEVLTFQNDITLVPPPKPARSKVSEADCLYDVRTSSRRHSFSDVQLDVSAIDGKRLSRIELHLGGDEFCPSFPESASILAPLNLECPKSSSPFGKCHIPEQMEEEPVEKPNKRRSSFGILGKLYGAMKKTKQSSQAKSGEGKTNQKKGKSSKSPEDQNVGAFSRLPQRRSGRFTKNNSAERAAVTESMKSPLQVLRKQGYSGKIREGAVLSNPNVVPPGMVIKRGYRASVDSSAESERNMGLKQRDVNAGAAPQQPQPRRQLLKPGEIHFNPRSQQDIKKQVVGVQHKGKENTEMGTNPAISASIVEKRYALRAYQRFRAERADAQ